MDEDSRLLTKLDIGPWFLPTAARSLYRFSYRPSALGGLTFYAARPLEIHITMRGAWEMEAGVLSTIISTVGAIGIAIVGWQQKNNQKHYDKCEELRAEGAILQLEMTQAELKLSKVTAKAVMNQKLNGDVEDAMRWVQAVEIKYQDYTRRMAQVVGGQG
jgi:hypothetical protein